MLVHAEAERNIKSVVEKTNSKNYISLHKKYILVLKLYL